MSIVTSVSGRDRDVARLRVRQRAVLGRGPRSRGSGLVGPRQAHLVLERERDLALGAPDQPALRSHA